MPLMIVLANLTLLSIALVLTAPAIGAEPLWKKIDFNFQIRPILSDKCFNCHGPDPRHARLDYGLTRKRGPLGSIIRVVTLSWLAIWKPAIWSRGSRRRMSASGCPRSRWADHCRPMRLTS